MIDEKLIKLVKDVAIFLIDNWQFEEKDGNYGVYLTFANEGLHFNFAWNSGRLEISGSFSGLANFLPYEREKTEITVTKDKSPERIAKDIEKRLLPPYRKMLAKAFENKKVNDAYLAKKKAALEAIKEELGSEAHIAYDDSVRCYKPIDCIAKHRGENGIELKLDIDLDKAIKIIKMLKEGH